MSNVFAAVGRVQLEKFPSFKKSRQGLAKRYLELLGDVPGIKLFRKDYNEIVPHIFAIRVLAGKRSELKSYLDENNVETASHYYPNHLLEYYRSDELPITEQIYSELLTIPLHPGVTDKDQGRVVDLIKEFTKNG